MSDESVTAFYERHPYPPPVADLDQQVEQWQDGTRRRIEHHRTWPSLPLRDDPTILVAGCGTSQAARYAVRYPTSRVIGIDVSQTSIDHTQALADQYGLDNLDLRVTSLSDVDELGVTFEHVVCTGVLHHVSDPDSDLRALRDVLSVDGALHLMLYATYGRTGVYMVQDYCRRLAVGTTPEEIDDLVDSLREIPLDHPIRPQLERSPDFADRDAVADALLHPRDRSYTVPEVFDLLSGTGLQFGRWIRQAPYLPTCGSLTSVPHGPRIAALPLEEQYAAVELYRGTMTRHSLIVHRDDATSTSSVDFTLPKAQEYVPVRPHTVVTLDERLPPGSAGAILNRAHEFSDLVLFVDEVERAVFEAIDGRRSIAELGVEHVDFFRLLHDHDLVVVDTSKS